MGYIGVNNPLILTIDPNFQRDIQVPPKPRTIFWRIRGTTEKGPWIKRKGLSSNFQPYHLGNLWNKSLTWFKAIFLGDSLTKPPFGVTSAEVVINCLDTIFQSF